jgi:hypothetical protein
MGYTDCLNFCTKQYWGGFTCAGCAGAYDTQSNSSASCDYIRGYAPKEIICFCTGCGPARECRAQHCREAARCAPAGWPASVGWPAMQCAAWRAPRCCCRRPSRSPAVAPQPQPAPDASAVAPQAARPGVAPAQAPAAPPALVAPTCPQPAAPPAPGPV